VVQIHSPPLMLYKEVIKLAKDRDKGKEKGGKRKKKKKSKK